MKQTSSRYRTVDDLAPRDREHHEVARSLADWFDPSEFKSRYLDLYPGRGSSSIQPSDYCFNRENKGNPKHPRFLCWDGGRRYRFVGLAPSAPCTETVARSARGESQLVPNRDIAAAAILSRPSSLPPPPSSRRAGLTVATGPVVPPHQLWQAIAAVLDSRLPDWRNRIEHFAQVAATEERKLGRRWSDAEVFEAVVRSVLSNSTDWSKVERVLPELDTQFHGFDLRWYAALKPADVEQTLVPWFQEHKAGSMTLSRSLERMIITAQKLLGLADQHSSLENYLSGLLETHGGNGIAVALALGGSASAEKWPGMGLPLAAEFVKNVGFDVAKPDRHVNRAVGCFELVQFANWPDRKGTRPPQATENEQCAVMRAMESWAIEVGVGVSFLDNAVWLLCAASGLHLGNEELSRLARKAVRRLPGN